MNEEFEQWLQSLTVGSEVWIAFERKAVCGKLVKIETPTALFGLLDGDTEYSIDVNGRVVVRLGNEVCPDKGMAERVASMGNPNATLMPDCL